MKIFSYSFIKYSLLIFSTLFFFSFISSYNSLYATTYQPKINYFYNIDQPSTDASTVKEENTSQSSILSIAFRGGPIVFTVLLVLVILSILSWAVLISKLIFLKKLKQDNQVFIDKFWSSRSLNDLKDSMKDFPQTPLKEIFTSGYDEVVKCSSLKESINKKTSIVSESMENIERALYKTKIIEKNKMEKNLSILSISASSSPFIGLFGTVWGIMGAFEGIAMSGSASLSSVAPGISEALTATAFGLAAAIPAVIGYNLSNSRIKKILVQIDSFSIDLLNIVERYFISDKKTPDETNS